VGHEYFLRLFQIILGDLSVDLFLQCRNYGWSRRSTLYGGNHSAGRNASLLDPQTDRARIRAMYTHPNHIKRGIGRLIIAAGEAAARAEGFKALEMAATKAGHG